MIYAVAERIAKLRSMIKEAHDTLYGEGLKAALGMPPGVGRDIGLQTRQKFIQQTAPWDAELQVLAAPIVGIAQHEGALFLVTEKGAFELRDGAFVAVPLTSVIRAEFDRINTSFSAAGSPFNS